MALILIKIYFNIYFQFELMLLYYRNKNINFVTCMKLQSRLASSGTHNLELQFRYTACLSSSYK